MYGRFSLSYFLEQQKLLEVTQLAFYQLPAHLWLDHERCIGLETVSRALRESGIQVVSFHPGRYQYSLFSRADTLRGACTMRYYRGCIDAAAALGCRTLCLCPSGSLLDGEREEELAALIQNLTALCRAAGERDVTVCVRTVPEDDGAVLHTLDELERVLDVVPELRAALDTVPMSQVGESIPQWFSRLGPRIGHVCFWDGRNAGGRIWGEGVYPSQSYAEQLLSTGFRGPVSICGRTAHYETDPAEADRRNWARARALLDREGGVR